jgi:hypothetical protein
LWSDEPVDDRGMELMEKSPPAFPMAGAINLVWGNPEPGKGRDQDTQTLSGRMVTVTGIGAYEPSKA